MWFLVGFVVPHATTRVQLNDLVHLVGEPEALKRVKLVIGEEEYIEGYQKTRIHSQNKVKECLRYVGYERTDDSWVKSGLASDEACELSKFGEILQL